MPKPIGGYFELELDATRKFPHDDGVLVGSGRNALEYILRGIGRVDKVYLPYYTCEVVLEPLVRLGIPYEFYHIDAKLEISEIPDIAEGEFMIVNNYFGVKDTYISGMCNRLAGKVIVDNSQAFFTPQYNNQPTFWSPRKFVGVPDGGIALPDYEVKIAERDESYDRCMHLLKRWDLGASEAYADFQANDEKLVGKALVGMSALTQALLKSIDFDRVRQRRKANYTLLRDALESSNQIDTPSADEVSCPMVYPFYTQDTALRQRLIENKIFVAQYWQNVAEWIYGSAIEHQLMIKLIPLPIDQRYNTEELDIILKLINL